ncbi:iron-sulfur cluster-binding domain-containing protein, partial [Planktomarina temperata]|nr:iron-sulfur cluster-binding domain-containing protein [Planktomarina temperata]
ELHIFVQTKADLAFPEILKDLDALTKIYMGLSPQATRNVISGVLANYVAAQHVYICGPGVMLEAAREAAKKCGWPDEAVHFEYFKNSKEIDDKTTFEIALSRSALTLQVPAGKTILQILRENGIEVPSSCEQGACGTCLMTVIGGEPDHQDVYLSTKEKASNQKIITCVSRSKSNQLVLDI